MQWSKWHLHRFWTFLEKNVIIIKKMLKRFSIQIWWKFSDQKTTEQFLENLNNLKSQCFWFNISSQTTVTREKKVDSKTLDANVFYKKSFPFNIAESPSVAVIVEQVLNSVKIEPSLPSQPITSWSWISGQISPVNEICVYVSSESTTNWWCHFWFCISRSRSFSVA